jgi:putative mRNA 3-end processing factor
MALISLTPEGLYCEAGGFHIDPWRPVPRAVITHAHSDHASWGHEHYLLAKAGEHVARKRLGDAHIETVEYGAAVQMNDVRVSLHPAGHVLGSSQVRVEHRGEVWVVSGDYKVQRDPTCEPFEPIVCDTFITESTFGLPIYRWREPEDLFGDVNAWWRNNQSVDRASVVYAYALGKAQRLLMSIDPAIGPIYTHGAVEGLNDAYRASGVILPPTQRVSDMPARGHDYSRALIIAPPSAQSTPWLRRFGDYADAFASGWMQIRGIRRRRAVDRGFTLSDHADWPGLLSAIGATRAERVYVTHGYSEPLVRWLCEHGLDAQTLSTRFTGEQGSAETEPAHEESAEGDAEHRREAPAERLG